MMQKLTERARAGIAWLIDTRPVRWLAKHRPLWDFLWGVSACAMAIATATWPTDRMRATAIGLALVWLVEQSLLLRAIRRQRVHQITMRNCETGIHITGGASEAETREAVQRAIEQLGEEVRREQEQA